MGALMILGAMLAGAVAPGRLTQGKLILRKGPDKAQFEDFYEEE